LRSDDRVSPFPCPVGAMTDVGGKGAVPSSISPKTMDWGPLRVFYIVATAGSFTSAGRLLNLSQSAVSRQIAGLERELKVALFHRHVRGLVLTESGDNLYRTVSEMAERMAVGLASVDECREAPKGSLKITTSLAFGSAWLTSRINKFHSMFPDITVSLLLIDNLELDLSLRQADIAIRFAPQTRPNLIQRRLMTIQYHIFASKEYLQRRGVPKSAKELDRHDVIVYGDDLPGPVNNLNWLLEAGATLGKRREPTLRVNNIYGIFRAVVSGLGIAALPYYVVEGRPELVEILPELEGPQMEAFLVYPEELRHSRRIDAVRDFLLQEVREEGNSMRLNKEAGFVLPKDAALTTAAVPAELS
jgi:DNA-binding transcriptional LysR family regulator